MSVHTDTLKGLQEALEYTKGNLDLRTTTVEIPDEEVKFYSVFSKLTEENKVKVMDYVNALL